MWLPCCSSVTMGRMSNTLHHFFRDFLNTPLTLLLSHQYWKDMHTLCFWSNLTGSSLVLRDHVREWQWAGQEMSLPGNIMKTSMWICGVWAVTPDIMVRDDSMGYRLAGKLVFKFRLLSSASYTWPAWSWVPLAGHQKQCICCQYSWQNSEFWKVFKGLLRNVANCYQVLSIVTAGVYWMTHGHLKKCHVQSVMINMHVHGHGMFEY